MRDWFYCNLLWLMLVLPAIGSSAAERDAFDLRDGDRVVWIGGAFVERMQASDCVEAALTAGYPDRDITFRNLGWSGDTVFGEARGVFGSVEDGFQRLLKDVRQANPTVLLVAYGSNEAHAGPAGLPRFETGLVRLLDELSAPDIRIVLLLPRDYEDVGRPLPSPAEYNANLHLYREKLREVAERRKLRTRDLNALVPLSERLTDNGVHFTPAGYARIAGPLAESLGAKRSRWSVELDGIRVVGATGANVREVKATSGGIQFTSRSHVLCTRCPTGAAAGCQQLKVAGLAPGRYELRIAGEPVLTKDAAAWARGVSIPASQDCSQAEQLRQAIQEKNTLYFHRYRPQNETYLFLFRKHEQGNNAVEIPQFDSLVAEKEREIAGLRVPIHRTYELTALP